MRPLGLAALAALAVTVAGCASSSGDPAADGKIAVVTSTDVWGSVAAAVGGDAVAVQSLIAGEAADPHAYQDKPSDAVAISKAALTVHNGGGYDDFFAKLANAAGGHASRIVAFDLAGKGPSGSTNEHVWYDLPSVRKVADRVAEELGAIAPDRRDTFAANAKAFGAKLDTLAATTAKIGIDHPGARVVCTEPVPQYLLDLAGLTNVTPGEFSEAIEEETDPPAAAIAELDGLVAGKKVSAVINNVQTETPVTKALTVSANKSGVPVVEVTETLPEGVNGYVDWMTRQVDALAKALAKTT
jgi:zinc/manganese transport system substrate-binding protein